MTNKIEELEEDIRSLRGHIKEIKDEQTVIGVKQAFISISFLVSYWS